MSQKNNVNPNHYKQAGRNRPNEIVPATRAKQDRAEDQARLERLEGPHIPNQSTQDEHR